MCHEEIQDLNWTPLLSVALLTISACSLSSNTGVRHLCQDRGPEVYSSCVDPVSLKLRLLMWFCPQDTPALRQTTLTALRFRPVQCFGSGVMRHSAAPRRSWRSTSTQIASPITCLSATCTVSGQRGVC